MANDFVIRGGFNSLNSSQITGSLSVTQGITGSLFGTSSWSRNAVSTSFSLNTDTASLSLTASSADNFFVRQNLTASSLFVTESSRILLNLQTTGSVQFSYISSVWSAGGAMITARSGLAGAGTQNEGLAFGGANKSEIFIGDSFGCTCTEEYNGTSWAAGGAMSSSPVGGGLGAGLAGVGTQNEALGIGGAGANGSFILPFRCSVEYNGTAWSGGGSPNVGKIYHAAAGTQNSAVAFGGLCLEAPPIPSQVSMACTEEYNGSSWSTGGAMITARRCLAGAGTQNEALAFGAPTCTEEYNGTTWASGGSMITGRSGLAGAGSQNAALGFGSPTNTEEYDGTTWTTRTAMITGRAFLGGAGSQALALAFGGEVPTCVACTEEYNCSILTSFSYLSTTGRIIATGSLFGTASIAPTSSFSINPTASLSITASTVLTSSFAATSSFVNVLNQNVTVSGSLGVFVGSSSRLRVDATRVALGNAITETSAITGSSSITGSLLVTGSVSFSYGSPSGVWTAGGAVITARQGLGGAGTQNEGLAFGGLGVAPTSTVLACTEEYNGTSWAVGGALINARQGLAGAGTQNEGLAFGGRNVANCACTEEYNGTTWTAGGALITARRILAGAGTQNVGLAFSGYTDPPNVACTEEYDGTSWTAGGAMITTRRGIGGAGTQNAALGFGGFTTVIVACTEAYNGTSWSTGGAMITARTELRGAGLQNAALAFGGCVAAEVGCTEAYNGTTWSTRTSMITSRRNHGPAGIQTSALTFGGATPTVVACTEEFNALQNTFSYSSTTGQLQLNRIASDLNFISDGAAASGSVPLGGLYRSGSELRIRVS